MSDRCSDDLRPLYLDETQARRIDYLEKRFATYIINSKRLAEDEGYPHVPMHKFLDGYGDDAVTDERVRYLAIFGEHALTLKCRSCGEFAPLSAEMVCAWGCSVKTEETKG